MATPCPTVVLVGCSRGRRSHREEATVQDRGRGIHGQQPRVGGLAGSKDGQLLIPLVELLEKGERAIDEVIDVMGRATVEAVLQMSAEQVAGPKAQGRRGPDREVYWHGVQEGRVALKGTAVAGHQAAAAQEAVARRRVGRGGDSRLHGVVGEPGAGRPDAGVGAERGVDAPLCVGAAGAGRPSGDQQVGGLAGDHRGGDAGSGGAGRTGPERQGSWRGGVERDGGADVRGACSATREWRGAWGSSSEPLSTDRSVEPVGGQRSGPEKSEGGAQPRWTPTGGYGGLATAQLPAVSSNASRFLTVSALFGFAVSPIDTGFFEFRGSS